ncbi:MAG: metal-dependent hydrolase, partial [Lachnospiraceae bacterium]|nr:metal-dependent hydrolase [Lachnospiraceae bacterium]
RSMGAVIRDIDCKSNRHNQDVLYGRIIAGGIALTGLLYGQFDRAARLFERLLATPQGSTILGGLLLFLLLCILGRLTPHRSFTHSLPGMFLMSYAIFLIYPPFAESFCVSFLFHLALDILNKKPVRLLYPLRKGFSLNLCYADGIVNRLLFGGGLLTIGCYVLLFLARLCTIG